jgi:outer membrane biosynthesis protein TonB
MKQETNNEIDLLLRRLGRRPEGGVSAPDGCHLDADELSSYAENALPPSARSRYTEHLAQCSSCRTLVVQLSSAAGVVVAPERSVVAEPSGFRKFLASLLSPLVLRYAIPALGLAVIAVIGLTVFRPDRQPDTEVAQQTNAAAPENGQLKAPSAASSGDNYKAEGAKTAPAPTAAATPDAGSINMSEAPTPAPTAVESISAPVTDSTAAATVEAAPPPKPEPPPVTNAPATSPTPAATEVNERKVEVEKQAAQTAREPQRSLQARDEGRRSANEAASTTASAAKKKGDFSSSPQAGAGVGGVQRDGRGEKDRDDAEIRTVAGRRFRKQRGVWVDTAYESSSETTNLTRGSERYRALVADEPAIKSIADQLDGEIIVVWKGRPYRIR